MVPPFPSPDPSGPASPAAFSRDHRQIPVSASSRIMAALLTVSLYALLLFLAQGRTFWKPLPQPDRSEVVAQLMPEAPHKASEPPRPPLLARITRPRTQSIAPPSFTVEPDTPVLAAPAAPSEPPSPLAGEIPAGTGAAGQIGPASGDSGDAMMGQVASAEGISGNGTAPSGCWDAAWAKAVRDRIGKLFYYPRRARDVKGVVIVQMRIFRNGRVSLVKVAKSSGNQLLDQAAVNMVRNAQPVPRIPERMHTDRVNTQIPIEFGDTGLKFSPTQTTCG